MAAPRGVELDDPNVVRLHDEAVKVGGGELHHVTGRRVHGQGSAQEGGQHHKSVCGEVEEGCK